MDKKIGVRVTYRNRNLDSVYSRIFELKEYTEQMRSDLQGLVSDVETLCYDMNDGKPIEEWTEESFRAFNKIKHKLLDKAGDIGRLPDNMVEIKGEPEPLNDFVARILKERS